MRRAFGDLWDTYLGDLLTWTLVVTVVAWLVAAASASLLSPYSPAATMGRLWTLARRPVSTRARIARGAVALGLGLFVVLKPTLALRVFAILGGCALLYVGAGELLTATARARRRPAGVSGI